MPRQVQLVAALSFHIYKGAYVKSLCSLECRYILRDPYTANILYLSQFERIDGKFTKLQITWTLPHRILPTRQVTNLQKC